MGIPVQRDRMLNVLANDIMSNGIDIDIEDIEKLVDIYLRVLITLNSENGIYNTKPIDHMVNITSDISITDDNGVESIKNFIRAIDDLSSNDHNDGSFEIHPLSEKTLTGILSGVNIVSVFKCIHRFLDYVGNIGYQFVQSNAELNGIVYKFTSIPEQGIFSVTMYPNVDGNVSCKVYSNCLVSEGKKG